jgi:hypothetical protein
MNVQLFLADYATLSEGKLNALGMGWTFTGPGPSNFALVGVVSIPWGRTNERHTVKVVLMDGDGQAVRQGGDPIQLEGQFEAGRPPGSTPGAPITMLLPPLNIAGLPLRPASRYEWVASIDGETHEGWRVGFGTRPLSEPASA